MKRLTKRISENLIELSAKANPIQYNGSPQRVHVKHPFWNVFNKLCEYEDAEEQGKLIRLPCKVGDTIYLVDFEEKMWDEATVNSIEVDTRDNRVLINSDYEVGTWSEDSYVFYSKEEAEQALAKMKEV